METKSSKEIIGHITMVHEKGYGFIVSEEVRFVKFFFHWTGLSQNTLKFPELKKGMKVSFIPIDGGSGPRAVKVRVINSDMVFKNNVIVDSK